MGARSARLSLTTVVVAALVLGDGALVYAALHRSSHPAAAAQPLLPAASTPTPTPTPARSGSPSGGQASSSRPVAVGAVTRLLTAALDDKTAWRATWGCAAPADLAVTHDGGRSWAMVHAPAPHVLRLAVTGVSSGVVVGADESCHATSYRTTDVGVHWSPDPVAGHVWVATPAGVVAPDRRRVDACGDGSSAAAVAAGGTTRAVAVCAGRLRQTRDGGATWHDLTAPAGRVVAVALNRLGTAIVVSAGVAGCAGVVVSRAATLGGPWARSACLPGWASPVGVSLTGAGVGLMTAAGHAVSTVDDGRSWR